MVPFRPTGTPYHYLADRLARLIENQWPGVRAASPLTWLIESNLSGKVITGRFPDILVGDDSVYREAAFTGQPLLVVEVWSPTDTVAEMNGRRLDYLRAPARYLAEVQVLSVGVVRISCFINAVDHWRFIAGAEGPDELVVDVPNRFSVVPNKLFH